MNDHPEATLVAAFAFARAVYATLLAVYAALLAAVAASEAKDACVMLTLATLNADLDWSIATPATLLAPIAILQAVNAQFDVGKTALEA
jgi:hypothetical protein